ncbi:acetyl-CoA carboxylase biotin carboxylase subunit [candidate division KSB1 bacterium]|nr:acetyl-CoA carboxylase biotin carboxylase subunit [bacterium]OQX60124.1 MAG: acetyl-CoA carboxylase biotin carboxylase subunit [candidate division KSB1 bacterium 4484_219]RKY80315.1 MAG: acetyl-CoA carboxylase biotin carboxylase subunit [candidate division KSB1 bacterium]HDI51157.1 acetyl-CoA carboxylase biotin carboxylase subunit [Bacteroidota bacterium]RKY87154.1 MAG: acetyl-CoA carboxylase biotin carboxylase subunit [candidate division KSB1 bacterium]
MFNKILIANRGEIALRIIRACKELGIKTVAVYSQADVDSLHVRFADEAVCIGPPPSSESYLNIPRLISAAEITNAEAIHPGYGFLAENSRFAEISQSCNIRFIGPSPEVIDKMGNKSLAKETMRKAGIPVIPGSEGVIKTVSEAKEIAKTIGYPVILKASAGGGGKGMRIVQDEEQLENAFETAQTEATAAFGNGDLYLEKFFVHPRHIEIQILGDDYGNVIALGERECSIQRKHQKLIEEAPSPAINQQLRDRICAAALKGAKAVGYTSAGTIEFLLDTDGNFYFMEVNTRIQVEHPVTEMVIGLDLVKEQIRLAAKGKLDSINYKMRGHAIECRINAENPTKNFMPSPGTITYFHIPGGPGVRVDTHAYAQYVIPPYYDSLLAKVIIHGRTREEALRRLQRALEEFVIEGVQTTIPFHLKVLEDERFRNGEYDINFLESFELSS